MKLILSSYVLRHKYNNWKLGVDGAKLGGALGLWNDDRWIEVMDGKDVNPNQ